MTTSDALSHWEAIGGIEGGTVSAILFSPAYAMDKVVFAATLAGVHRSTDGGKTWSQASQGLASPFVDAIVASPNYIYDHTLYAGGRDAGVSRSTDGGATWETLRFWSRHSPSIASLTISPNYGDDGHVFAGADDGLVYRSSNHGRTWNAIDAGLPGSPVLALAVSPGYANDGAIFAATQDGPYRFDGAKKRWVRLGLDGHICQAIALTRTFETDATIFVGTEDAGLFRSTDGGTTWEPLNTGLADLCVNAIALSPTFVLEQTILVATASGIYRTRDGGASWSSIVDTGPTLTVAVPPTFTQLEPGPGEPDLTEMERTALAGTPGGGVLRSTDHGATWRASNTGLRARLLVGLAVSPNFGSDQTLFSSGLEEGVMRSTDGGLSWISVGQGATRSEVAGIAISPAYRDDGVIATATAAGIAISRTGGETWLDVGGPAIAQTVAIAPNFHGTGTIVASSKDGVLYRTDDAGLTWRRLETPFEGEEIAMLAFSPDFATDGILFAATSRSATAERQGRAAVWWTIGDQGAWQPAFEEPTDSHWLSLAVSPTFAADAAFFIGVGNRVLRPLSQARETRGGIHRPVWQPKRPGSASTTIVGLSLSPTFVQDRTLFAATNTGVYVSRDAGASWKPLREGLTELSIVAVAVAPTYPQDGLLFAAGLGGTIWRCIDRERRA